MNDAKAHIQYVGFREREDPSDSLGLFSEHEDSVEVSTFLDSLDEKRFRHPKDPYIHTLLFTMSGKEWERSGFERGDYQKMIRQVMKQYEIKKGYRLKWIAAEHFKKDSPHVHVAIRASYFDRDGIERKLNITDADRKFFRDEWREARIQNRPMEPYFGPDKDFSLTHHRTMDLNKMFVTKLLDQIQHEFDRDRREQEMARKNVKKRKGKNASEELMKEHLKKRDR